MDHHRAHRHEAAAETRSVSEILADARELQGRHAPRILETAASWVRDRFVSRAGEHSTLVARRLVIH